MKCENCSGEAIGKFKIIDSLGTRYRCLCKNCEKEFSESATLEVVEQYLMEEELSEMNRIKEQKEMEKAEYANSFHEYYEYDVVTILNKEHGQVNEKEMKDILNQHAVAGWKLHSIYSNELGKNAVRIVGLGMNSTACEDVLIFERRIENNIKR